MARGRLTWYCGRNDAAKRGLGCFFSGAFLGGFFWVASSGLLLLAPRRRGAPASAAGRARTCARTAGVREPAAERLAERHHRVRQRGFAERAVVLDAVARALRVEQRQVLEHAR